MICPACGKTLQNQEVGGVAVNVCKDGCGGIWFDQFHLKKVTAMDHATIAPLLALVPKQGVSVTEGSRWKCPRCEEIVMMRHFYSIKQEVEIDECPECAGLWVKGGDFARICALFGSEEEKKKAEEEYLQKFRVQLESMQTKPPQKAKRW